MKSFWLSVIVLAGLCGCGSIIKAPVSQEEFAKVKHVGVASAFDNQFYGRHVGFTVFGNEKFTLDISHWDVNKIARTRAVELLRQENPGWQVASLEVPPFQTLLTDRDHTWLASAQQQGFDTVVLLKPANSDNFPFFGPGVGVYSRFKLTCVYTAYVIAVFDVASRKQIAWEWGATPPCDMGHSDSGVQFKSDPAQYSQVELDRMRELVTEKFARTEPQALKDLHLIGGR